MLTFPATFWALISILLQSGRWASAGRAVNASVATTIINERIVPPFVPAETHPGLKPAPRLRPSKGSRRRSAYRVFDPEGREASMKLIRIALIALVGGALALAAGSFAWEAYFHAQRADYGWSPNIAEPAYAGRGPAVLFDEGHHNVSTAGLEGRYWPFRRLLDADGYRVSRLQGRFTRKALDRAAVLVVVNAAGAGKPQAFGINLPFGGEGRREGPAF